MQYPSKRSIADSTFNVRKKQQGQSVDISRWTSTLTEQFQDESLELLDTIPGLVWKTDENGLYTYFNQAWLAFRGRTLEEEKGLGWIEGIHPSDLKQVLDILAEACIKNKPFTRHFRLMGADRQYHWIKDAGRPLLRDGEFYGYCGTAIDHTSETLNAQALCDSLEKKNTLFKEAHHRIKNNLQILTSLLRLQAEHSSDDRLKSILEDCHKRIAVIALLHQKLFDHELGEELNFSEYVQDLVRIVANSYGDRASHIRLNVDVEPLTIHVDKVIAGGLIITELLSNAFKHAFPNASNGKIELRFHLDSGYYILEVEDDGIGFPENLSIQETKSLGLRVVSALIHQLDGSYQVRRKGGARFRISFPR